ncbi:unnamed protein product [Paramecium pentaurelia]|uniref:Transmembrane protein n=1 Tax=Paramecium pentaurelia TaxID=43138 RepID=A0A8S1RUZ9_9CILI|nr:unnamed protein product [Paramecium pentaurelia]
MLSQIVQYLGFVRILYQKQELHLSYKENLQTIKEKIQNLYSNQKEVAFWKTFRQSDNQYSQRTLKHLLFKFILYIFLIISFFCSILYFDFLRFIQVFKKYSIFRKCRVYLLRSPYILINIYRDLMLNDTKQNEEIKIKINFNYLTETQLNKTA